MDIGGAVVRWLLYTLAAIGAAWLAAILAILAAAGIARRHERLLREEQAAWIVRSQGRRTMADDADLYDRLVAAHGWRAARGIR